MRTDWSVQDFCSNYRRYILIFASLNVLDLLLTSILLKAGGAYEANPFAATILGKYGWWGMACLKVYSVSAALALIALVSRRRPEVVTRLLALACAIVGGVVAYSAFVLAHSYGDSDSISRLENAEERGASLAQRWAHNREHIRNAETVAQEIVTGKLSLVQGVQQLTGSLQRLDRDPLLYVSDDLADLTQDARLAAYLMNYAGYLVHKQPARSIRLLDRLQSEFRLNYGPPVHFALQWFSKERS